METWEAVAILLGLGRPLLPSVSPRTRLALTGNQVYPGEIVLLIYSVAHDRDST
jgi:hypothetical protein